MRVVLSQFERRIETARLALVEAGFDEAIRRKEIDALERKDWHGKLVYKIRCHGTRGKGPHDVWVGEQLLWFLISLTGFVCPYHIGDDPTAPVKEKS